MRETIIKDSVMDAQGRQLQWKAWETDQLSYTPESIRESLLKMLEKLDEAIAAGHKYADFRTAKITQDGKGNPIPEIYFIRLLCCEENPNWATFHLERV